MTESERKRIPAVDSREEEGTTTVLFSFEGGNVKSSVIQRRTQERRENMDLDRFKFIQVLALPVMI